MEKRRLGGLENRGKRRAKTKNGHYIYITINRKVLWVVEMVENKIKLEDM